MSVNKFCLRSIEFVHRRETNKSVNNFYDYYRQKGSFFKSNQNNYKKWKISKSSEVFTNSPFSPIFLKKRYFLTDGYNYLFHGKKVHFLRFWFAQMPPRGSCLLSAPPESYEVQGSCSVPNVGQYPPSPTRKCEKILLSPPPRPSPLKGEGIWRKRVGGEEFGCRQKIHLPLRLRVLYVSFFQGILHQVSKFFHVQFFHYVGPVVFGGSAADEQKTGNFFG